MDDRKRTITVEEAARLLGIGRSLAYELARRGELPGALHLGGRIVVSRSVLERFLAGDAPQLPGGLPVSSMTALTA